jgi:hypothetical protein
MILRYIKKRESFENKTGNLVIHKDYSAFSYRWAIGSYIDNVGIVLNNWKYSLTTQKHIKEYRRFLQDKGIEFKEVCIDSPVLTKQILIDNKYYC